MRKNIKLLVCFGFMAAMFLSSNIQASTKKIEIPRQDAVYRKPYRHSKVKQNKIIGIGVAVIACAGSVIFMYKRGIKIQNQFIKNGIEMNTYSWRWNKRKLLKRVKEITIALQDPHIIHSEYKIRCYVTAKFYKENQAYFNRPMNFSEIKILATYIPFNNFLADVEKQGKEKGEKDSEQW